MFVHFIYFRSFQFLFSKAEKYVSSVSKLNAFKQYRQIQIMCGYFNQTHCFIITTCLSTAILGQVISFFGLLTNENVSDSLHPVPDIKQMIATYFLKMCFVEGLVLTITCINCMYGFCGNVNFTSEKCLRWLQHEPKVQKSVYLKILVRSLPPLKVKFGSVNYISKLTPVVFQQFTNERIIETLLICSI